MLQALIESALRHRAVVFLGLIAAAGWGAWTMIHLPIEAFPDMTNNQVIVITECKGMAPQEVEQLVSYPLETALMGVPKTQAIRSISKLGLSMVTLVLDDDVPTYFARQLVNERLQEARSRLPMGLEPSLGPVATAFGEVLQYTVEGGGLSARELKTLHDWQIKNQLRTVRGVSEVNTWGGETARIEIRVDAAKLRGYDLTLREVFDRVRENNRNFSAGFIEHASEQYTVLGIGRARKASELENIVLRASRGTPLLLRDVAEIAEGALPRQGATLKGGLGETVSGMVIMLKGENGRDVLTRAKERIAGLHLPKGVKLVPFYDQSVVIDGTLATVEKNLLEAGGLVILVLLLFLGNFRAALIVALAIPVSMLVGFIGMAAFGVTANLMSLGAVDFGMIVDGAVVMVENSVRHLHRRAEDKQEFQPLARVREAAIEVGRPITFAVGIIIAVYLPILFLEGLEGKMFRPMAITVCSALVGSLAYALFIAPSAASMLLSKGVAEHEGGWFERLLHAYRAVLRTAIRLRPAVLLASLAVVGVAIYSLSRIGSEFMPRLDEGSILITTRKLPGIALTDSVSLSREVEKRVLSFPEVAGVVTKLGRPDLATEAMGIYEADVYVQLKSDDSLRGAAKDDLITRMSKRLEEIPGVSYNFTQPMAMRLDEVISGIKADLALKLFGDDQAVLNQLGERALRILSSIPGSADTQLEITTGVPELRIIVDRAAVARYGLNVTDVEEVVRAAVQGSPLSELVVGQRRIPVVGKISTTPMRDPEALAALPLHAPAGERIPLGRVANVIVTRGAEVISREGGQRRVVVQSNVRGRDLGSFAAEAQRRVARELQVPPGYSIDWGGQFENQERAMKRLALVIPLSLSIIFGLLYGTFHSFRQAALLIMIVPFSLVGGVAALLVRGMNLNLSALIGFVALSGVAVLNGIVMVSAINRLRSGGESMEQSVLEGAASRLRPVLMTAMVASFGFVPMALSQSTGAEVQRPLATVVIGGLASATALTLILLPVLYPWFSRETPRD